MSVIPADLYEIPRGIAYLNCAGGAPLAKPVLLAGQEAMLAGPWDQRLGQAGLNSAQARVAKLIGAYPETVAATACPVSSLCLAVQNLSPKAGKTVLCLDGHPVWPGLAGLSQTTVAKPESGDWTEAVLQAISEEVALAIVPHCHPGDGTVLDLGKISQACHQAGGLLAVDGSWSLGVLPLDVAAINLDFLFALGDKWLFCPAGVGFFHQNPSQGQIKQLPEPIPGYVWAMAGAGLDLVETMGAETIQADLAASVKRLSLTGQAFGLKTPNVVERAPHILALAPPRGHAPALAKALASHKVFVGVAGDCLRLSPHVNFTDEYQERFTTALARSLCT